MSKRTNIKSLKNFKDAELTSEQASNVNGSSRILNLLHQQNLSYIEQITAIHKWFYSVGVSQYKSFHEKIISAYKSHHKTTTNIICYGNVNGLED